MNDSSGDQQLKSRRERVQETCVRFEQLWQAGEHPSIEDFLDRANNDDRRHLLRELIVLEIRLELACGQRSS